MASRLALRILIRSISSTSTMPIAQHSACALMIVAIASRWSAVINLESLIPGYLKPRGRTTAAAITGPANGPRPTSSKPAIDWNPRKYPCSSTSMNWSGRLNSSDNGSCPRRMALSFSQKGRQLQIKFGRNADSTEPAELELPQSLCYKNTMKLTREEIQRIAALARLRLTAEEEEHLTEQLDRILQYMDKLNEVDTSKVEPLAHVIDIVK